MTEKSKIFLSHAGEDHEQVTALAHRIKRALKALGHAVKVFAQFITATRGRKVDRLADQTCCSISSILTFPLCCLDQISCCFPKRTT